MDKKSMGYCRCISEKRSIKGKFLCDHSGCVMMNNVRENFCVGN